MLYPVHVTDKNSLLNCDHILGKKIISLLKNEELSKNARFCFLLDFDGTLAPIVPIPNDAVMSSKMREAVNSLSCHYNTSIVSGRERTDVQKRVGLDHVNYAGSHGFEIDIQGKVFQVFKDHPSMTPLNQCFNGLKENLSSIPGCILEHNVWSLSVHYRNCNDEDVNKVTSFVQEWIQLPKFKEYLKLTFGKKVYEIRLNLDWHKGKAIAYILDKLQEDVSNKDIELGNKKSKHTYSHEGLSKDKNTVDCLIIPIYIGDDTTDEDAFKEVNSRNGISILVAASDDPRIVKGETAAKFYVNDTEDVQRFLDSFSGM